MRVPMGQCRGLTRRPVVQRSLPPLVGRPDQWLLIVPDSPAWLGPGRIGLYAEHLRAQGIDCVVQTGHNNVIDRVRGFGVIWNHALVADVPALDRYAQRNPECRVVHVNHSSLAYLEYTPGTWRKFVAACESARSRQNVWCVSQAESGLRRVLQCDRVRHVPMPVPVLDPRPYRPAAQPPVIVLAGRACPVKNQFNSLIAVAQLGNQVQLHLCVPVTPELAATCDLLGLKPVQHGMLPHSDWLQFLRDQADVLLQPSLTESYNVISAEAQQIGVPTVAAESVHCAVPELTVGRLNSPGQIASAIRVALMDYRPACERAIEFAGASVAERNLGYRQFCQQLRSEVAAS